MKMWCIFNLFVDDVCVCNRPAEEFHCRRSFMSYRISSVTFGSLFERDIAQSKQQQQKPSKFFAFHLFILRTFLSKQESYVSVCVYDISILAIVVARIWIFSGKISCQCRHFFSPCHANFQYSVSYSHVHFCYFFPTPALLCFRVHILPPIRIYFTALTANSEHPIVFVRSLKHIVWINYK